MVGIIAGTIAANILGDRTLWVSLLKGFCNAGEPVLVVWLIERTFGRPFTFKDLRSVTGFVMAALFATSVSALAGAAIMTLLHQPAPYWEVWRAWFLSAAVGPVMVAPIVIEFGQCAARGMVRERMVEGLGVLALLP